MDLLKNAFRKLMQPSTKDIRHAVLSGNVSGLRRLIARGADMGLVLSPTHLPLVAMAEKKEMTDFLIALGADTKATHSGIPVLHYAARNNWVDTVKTLAAQDNTDLDARDSEGWTAMMHGATAGNWDTVRALLFAGALAGIKTPAGRTALDFTQQTLEKDRGRYHPVLVLLKEAMEKEASGTHIAAQAAAVREAEQKQAIARALQAPMPENRGTPIRFRRGTPV